MPTAIDPVALATHYSRFRVADRILLTGHSHQAWPDVAFEAQQRAWSDAAEYVDDKWSRAAEQAELVRAGFARLLGDSPSNIALGQNTHELVIRWLSALPLGQRPRIVTTDGEFHSVRRQLTRLAEGVLPVSFVPARPTVTLAERIEATVDDRTACVIVSSVLFDTAEIVPGLDRIAAVCEKTGARLLVDAYHHLNVVPFDVRASGLDNAFITGGGYKYCQLGEGNCFLRVPSGCDMRPAITGWFAEMPTLDTSRATGGEMPRVTYGSGAAAFAGATYDPTSNYRAAAVFDFHRRHGLTADRLRENSRRQIRLLVDVFEAADPDPRIARLETLPDERRGGFLAIHTSRAGQIVRHLRDVYVFVDARGDMLRVGPAPYLRDDQLQTGMQAIVEQFGTKPPFTPSDGPSPRPR